MSKFQVVGGLNSVGRSHSKQAQCLTGPRGTSRYGSMTSPIEGQIPDPHQYRAPPALATRLHDIVSPNFAQQINNAEDIETIKTNKTKRNT